MTPSLTERLRSETKSAHTAAERSGIMGSLLRGTISLPAYVAMLQSLERVYAALESELATHASHPALAFIDTAALRRTTRIRSDIAVLTALHPAASLPDSPASRDYAAAIHDVALASPGLLVAHAYLRYLGDLSGGVILRKVVARALGDAASAGLSFYDFPDIAEPDAFKTKFRNDLDAVPFDHDEQDAVVKEALRGYAYHEAMFTELAS